MFALGLVCLGFSSGCAQSAMLRVKGKAVKPEQSMAVERGQTSPTFDVTTSSTMPPSMNMWSPTWRLGFKKVGVEKKVKWLGFSSHVYASGWGRSGAVG